MSFISVLTKIGQAATAIGGIALPIAANLGLKTPPLTAILGILNVVLPIVLKAEADLGSASGPAKKAQALNESLPQVLAIVEALIGRDIIDEARMKTAVDKYVEATVDFLNAIKSTS